MTGFKKISVLALALLMVVTSVFAQGTKEDASASGQVELTVLNYIDMSEPNSANEIKMVWDKFEEENPDIKLVVRICSMSLSTRRPKPTLRVARCLMCCTCGPVVVPPAFTLPIA